MADDPHPRNAPPLFHFQSRRSVVHGTRGMVACTSPLAAQAGLKILEAGGNAADAAVAAAAVLGVVDPSMTGIGGDVFVLFYDARRESVKALNASGRTPLAAKRESVCRDLGVPVGPDGRIDDTAAAGASIPSHSVHAITVPAAAAGWIDTIEQFGAGRLSRDQILRPAIHLAHQGFPVGRLAAYYWAMTEEDLRTRSPGDAGCELLTRDPAETCPGGFRAPREGELFRCPELANTLRSLATHGKAGFYKGAVAEAIVAASAALGGQLSMEDLERHAEQSPDISEALSMLLEGTEAEPSSVRLWEHPPNGQGIVALLAAGLLQELERTGKIAPLATMGHNSEAYLHTLISVFRIAFADAGWHVADPADGSVDARQLLSPAYLAQRAALFDADKAPSALQHGIPDSSGVGNDGSLVESHHLSDTVYLAVADEEGNGCSFVNSVSDRFGSCIVPKGTGFALPNRGRMFRLGPADHPNVFAGGKRAYNTIIPAILTEDVAGEARVSHRLRAVFGVMGGLMQPQGHIQVLQNMHAFGFDPQTALDAPRFCIAASLFSTSKASDAVYVEEGIPQSVVDGLRARGHDARYLTGYARSLFGRGQVIKAGNDPLTGQRVYTAGSDPRGDGHAVPLL